MSSHLYFRSSLSEKWFDFVLNAWAPRTDRIVLVPCASKKPFYMSVTHRSFLRRFWELWRSNSLDLVIVSEPLTVVPAEFDYPSPRYPLYDYPPKLIMKNISFFEEERRIWRNRLETFLSEISGYKIYYVLYPYHKQIFGDILSSYGAKGYFTERIHLAKTSRMLINFMGLGNGGKNFVVASL